MAVLKYVGPQRRPPPLVEVSRSSEMSRSVPQDLLLRASRRNSKGDLLQEFQEFQESSKQFHGGDAAEGGRMIAF